MDHIDAVRMSAVERYLLNELTPELRDEFEAHYFGCEECAADLGATALFIEAAKPELAKLEPSKLPKTELPANGKKVLRFPLFLRPGALIPAMAAMLAVIAFQNIVTFPAMKGQIAALDRPQLLSSVTLADGGSRGSAMPQYVTRAHQPFVVKVDVPAQDRYASYLCSLVTPSRKVAWQIAVPAFSTTEAVPILVSPDSTKAGVNTILVQGVPRNEPNAKPVDLSHDFFRLEINP